MRNALLATSFVAFLASCSKDSDATREGLLVHNDFDSIAGWVPENPSLTKEKAHSGTYSIKTDNGMDFSLAYVNTLGKLSPTKLSKVRLTAYVYVTKPSGAVLTLQINKSAADGTNVFNQGINIGEEVKKPNEWTKVSREFTLPADLSPVNALKLYLWKAASNSPVYVDDIELETI